MPRILFVTQTHNVWGGMELWLHRFSEWLMAHGWDVVAALPRGARLNDPDEYLRAHPHLRPAILDVRSGAERGRVLRLAGAIGDVRPDIVLPIASGATFDAMAIAREAGATARLVVPVRSLHPDLFCNIADRFDVVDHVVGVSRLIDCVLRELIPNGGERIHYVRHGAEPARHARVPRNGPLRAGFVGRLEESTKSISDLVKLAAMIGDDVELHVFGSGPDEALLDGARVRRYGALTQDELYERAYPMLDVLLLFSPAEGSPNAVYEAMQHGVVPVIARYAGQRLENIVRDGETGITFAIGDVAAAAAAVRILAHDASLLAMLSKAASAEIDSDERMHRDWLRILETALSMPPKASRPIELPKSGRLDLLPWKLADAIRRLRPAAQGDGWAEWPGTAVASHECVERVMALLRAAN